MRGKSNSQNFYSRIIIFAPSFRVLSFLTLLKYIYNFDFAGDLSSFNLTTPCVQC